MKNFIKNKNIIIIGPGACLIDDAKLVNVNSYDLVCKLNDHWRVKPDHFSLLTRRTDIIIHCMGINQYSTKDLELWKNRNIKILSTVDFEHPSMINHDKCQKFKIYNKGINLKLHFIPHEYKINYKKILNANPNTGVMAILYFLDCGAKSVTTIGFDFYDTLYHDKQDEKLLRDIQENKIGKHNPKEQLKNFKKYVKKYGNRFIPIGKLKSKLSKI